MQRLKEELVALFWLSFIWTVLGLAGIGSMHIILEEENYEHGRSCCEAKRAQLGKGK